MVGFRPNQTTSATTYQSRYGSDSYQMSSSAEKSSYAPRSTGWTCICGSKNPSSIDYCLSCRRSREEATEEKVKCPHCGANNKKKNERCFACGKPMNETPIQTDNTPKPSETTFTKKEDFSVVLKKLAELREQGILTEDEFAQKKAEILAKM